jgi:hypothetical protein
MADDPTDDDDDRAQPDDELLVDRFEAALLKAIKPGERATFAIAMRMTRREDGINLHAFAVSNETDEVSDVELAELLAEALRAVKDDAH